MKIVRPVVNTVGEVGGAVRDLGRLQRVAGVLVRHGLGWLVSGLEIPGLPRASPPFDSTPERALQAIQELGPTFVKLGQVLSTRPDVLPDEWCVAFTRLQDDVGAVPFPEIAAQLDAALGQGWRDRLTIEETPLATASIAQVYRAVLADGRRVVLKVQRPGIAPMIRADLNILYFLARRVLAEYPEAKSFDPVGVLQEFERSITAELDFLQEASNMERFRKNFAGDPDVHVPDVHPDLTTSTVLCMELLEGVKMREAREAGCDMRVVGERYLKCAYDQLFVHGLFHGDLHPGNVLVLAGDRIGLLDFGMVGRMTREMRDNVISIMFALQKGDFRTVARLFYEIAIKDHRLDYRVVEHETIDVMEKHWAGTSVQDMQLGAFVMDLAQRAARKGARIPTSYAMFFKAIMTSEGLAKSLIREVDPIAAIAPYFHRMLAERFSRESLEQEATYHLFTLQSLLARMPATVTQLLDDVDGQRVRFTLKEEADPRALAAADRRADRAITAGLAATFVACGTAAFLSTGGFGAGVPWLALLLWGAAAACLLVLLALSLRRRP